MKQCPNCKTTYTDETLSYCLTDGASLNFVSEGEETVVLERNKVRVDFQKDDAPESVATVFSPAFSPPPQAQTAPKKSGNWAVIGVLSALLIFVLLGFAGFAAYIFLKPEPEENRNVAVTSPTPTSSAPDTPDEDNDLSLPNVDEDLKEKVANLERQLEEQKNRNETNSAPNPFPTQTTTAARRTARANSPNDGFLALRSEPGTETGYRITKIPHGARISVLGCPKYNAPGKMKGRWCQVIYNGQQGWAFDAYMIFE